MKTLGHLPGALLAMALLAACGGDLTAAGGQGVPTPPAIASFTAAPATVTAGQATTLSWSVTDATALSISPGVGTVTGTSVSVSPATSTTYTLTAANAAGTVTATVAVAVTPASAPAIASFSASPAAITAGQTSTLSWSVTGATALSISPGVGTVTGTSVLVSPTTTTTYTLTATNGAGPATATATVTVTPGTGTPPAIAGFTASPAAITAGQTSTLSWSVTGATTLSIAPGVGSVTGTSVAVSPASTTTYTLTATNADGSATASTTVTVTPVAPPTIASFTASPASISAGGSSTLSWSVTGATALSISPGVGTVTGTSRAVSPASTTTYTLTATNAGGSATATATVTVTAASPPTIASFTASPASITAGGSSTLSWSVTGATGLSISPGVGSVTGTSRAVTPAATTTYTLTATNGTGSVTATTTVTVTSGSGGGTEYHVGPGQTYANIGDVPWYALQPGDTVYIHWRSTPYREKFLVSSRGTPTQWIRVLGVAGPNGELPVISGDGATTSTNMHYRWQDPQLVQWDGVIQIAVRTDPPGGTAPLPGYIEIAGLQVQDGYRTYRFTAENGTQSAYEGFAACIYARSAQHILIRDNVLTNCGQGFYNWTGDGSADAWYAGLEVDTVLRGNHFYNNGHSASYTEHQVYTESDGVIIEYNRFGPQRSGALGSQLKDRSAGTVIRYNYIEQSIEGWAIDLVEPEAGYLTLGSRASYRQAFVYGNVIVNRNAFAPSVIHWNEDHQAGVGRATLTGGRLFFYDNTLVTVANQSDMGSFDWFNVTWGGYDCPGATLPGTIDVRNNVFAVLPRTAGAAIPAHRFGYCGSENFDFGANWVSPGYAVHGRTVTGASNLVSPTGNDPGFVDLAGNDFHLAAGSTALGIGGALAPEVTSNSLGLDLTPTQQYLYHRGVEARAQSGAGSDAGAFER